MDPKTKASHYGEAFVFDTKRYYRLLILKWSKRLPL
jgi:hypothetical protein